MSLTATRPDRLLTPHEAAVILRLSTRGVLDLHRARRLPSCLTPGGHRRYPKAAVEALAVVLDQERAAQTHPHSPRAGSGEESTPDTTQETPVKIKHNLMPGFVMDVLDQKDCEPDSTRPDKHQQYKVIDPDGQTDWVCGYDVTVVEPTS